MTPKVGVLPIGRVIADTILLAVLSVVYVKVVHNDQKSPYLFFLHFESMIYKYLLCQILGHDFHENYEFSKQLPAITPLKNG